MAYQPRLLGLETEYGCLVKDAGPVHRAIQRLRDWMFDHQRYGLIDLHHRDWDEPPGNGGFLFNGGRVYEDMGHLEMCTPECASALETALYDQANDRLIANALTELDLADTVSIIRNNVDHYTGATFGCHENYLMRRQGNLRDEAIFALLAFLSLRGLYTGSGRVGGVESQRFSSPTGRSNPLLAHFRGFQITQRADYVENDFFRWVQGNRAIINTRDEPLADPRFYRRLHLLHGDTNVLPSATFLKLGTTRLIIDLLEIDALPEARLQAPVNTLKRISYDPDGPWEVVLHDGTRSDAITLLEGFREAAFTAFAGRDAETDHVLTLWERVNTAFRENVSSLVGVLDWITKKSLLDAFCEAEGLDYTDPWLEAQDLEYHNILPDRSLGLPLAENGPWMESEDAQEQRLNTPPQDTRAFARSRIMRDLASTKNADYIIDWDGVRWDKKLANLNDPYALTPQLEETTDATHPGGSLNTTHDD